MRTRIKLAVIGTMVAVISFAIPFTGTPVGQTHVTATSAARYLFIVPKYDIMICTGSCDEGLCCSIVRKEDLDGDEDSGDGNGDG